MTILKSQNVRSARRAIVGITALFAVTTLSCTPIAPGLRQTDSDVDPSITLSEDESRLVDPVSDVPITPGLPGQSTSSETITSGTTSVQNLADFYDDSTADTAVAHEGTTSLQDLVDFDPLPGFPSLLLLEPGTIDSLLSLWVDQTLSDSLFPIPVAAPSAPPSRTYLEQICIDRGTAEHTCRSLYGLP